MMQRRSARGRQSVDTAQEKTKVKDKDQANAKEKEKVKEKEKEKEKETNEEEQEDEEVIQTPTTPVVRKRGRPRRSEMKVEPKDDEEDTKSEGEESKDKEDLSDVVLNARGRPARQRKRNRYYDNYEEEDNKSPTGKVRPSLEKKVKLEKVSEKDKSEEVEEKEKFEPLQILLNTVLPSDLKVTPIISESKPEDFDTPVVHARKSAVKLIMSSSSSPKVKVEPNPVAPSLQVTKVEMSKPRSVYGRSSLPPKLLPMKPVKTESSTRVEIISKSESNRVEVPRKSDYYSFIRFFANVKTKVIMPDRWGLNGVMFDPVRKMKTFTISETEISGTGDLCIKKCIQIYEDLSLRIIIQGQDLTKQIEGLKKIHSDSDVTGIVSRILALKICTGVKNFVSQDLSYHPTAKKKGTSYFANDCQTVLSSNYVGALCPACNKLRNAMRRRRVKTKQEREKSMAMPNVKKVPNTFGRAIYSFLNSLMTDDKSKRGNLRGKDTKSTLIEVKVEPGTHGTPAANGRRRSGSAIKPPRKTKVNVKPTIKKENSGVLHGPLTIIDPATGMTQSVLPQGLIEYLTTMGGGENSNIVYQNGTEFSFGDGQEYELIGEGDPVEPIQLVSGGGGPEENTIQIIELDEQAMAQFDLKLLFE